MTPNPMHPHVTKPKVPGLFVRMRRFSPCGKLSHREMCRTGTHSKFKLVRPWKIPSGRVVSSLWLKDLWVSREGDEQRSNEKLATSHVFLPGATIYKRWPACQAAPTMLDAPAKPKEYSPWRDDLGTIVIASRPSQRPTAELPSQ